MVMGKRAVEQSMFCIFGTAPHAHATSSSVAGGKFGRLNLRRYAPVKACLVIR